jgi:dTDP-4-amino-4,6-dideoxygalactose transaminase
MAAILKVAGRHGLPVVEDAACAVGSEIRSGTGEWEKVGRPHGAVACFSFHPRKLLTTGDGGMLTTRDAKLDEKFRLLRQHAMSVSDRVRHAANSVIFEEYPELGFNYRMTDIQAAVGRVQLTRLPGILERRRRMAARYSAALREVPGLEVPFVPQWANTNYQSYAVRVTGEYPTTRDELMQLMLDAGVSTRRGIMNAHQEPAYAGTGAFDLPVSEDARDWIVLLPLHHELTEQDQDRVIELLRSPVRAAVAAAR